jgi:hypothetical protein
VVPLYRWPDRDAAGVFVVCCSCRDWAAVGAVTEVNRAAGAHDDSPYARHVVRIRGQLASGYH